MCRLDPTDPRTSLPCNNTFLWEMIHAFLIRKFGRNAVDTINQRRVYSRARRALMTRE